MRSRPSKRLALIICAVAGAQAVFAQSVPAQSVPVQAPDISRDAVMAYWAQSGRCVVSPPDDVLDKGVWQVRLTVAGSQWLWNYNRARHASAPPTQDAAPGANDSPAWEAWIKAKLAKDRWDAWQIAQRSNLMVTGRAAPKPDKSVPADEPPAPGPEPDGLVSLAGSAPRLAEAVVPMQYAIHFDDITLTYVDNVRMSNPRYAYYRFSQGTNSEGAPLKALAPDKLDHLYRLAGCNDCEAHVMRAVSSLEGGFDAVNTYDTGFVSVGFIQFATLKEGAGSLGGMLLGYKRDRPDKFALDFQQFGIDVTESGQLMVTDPATGVTVAGSDANAKVIDDKRLVAVFQRAGLVSEPFQVAQIKAAKQMFMPSDDNLEIALAGTPTSVRVGDFIRSEAGLATLMDRKVNTGHLDPLANVVAKIVAAHGVASLEQLCACECEIVAAMKYRKDYLADPTLAQPAPSSRPIGSNASRSGGARGHRKHGKPAPAG